MARSLNQKLKILYLLTLLDKKEDGALLTMNEILEELSTHGIQAERKSIYDDLEALRSFGYPIVVKRGRPSGYYLDRSADAAKLPERRIVGAETQHSGTLPQNPVKSAAESADEIAVQEPAGKALLPEWLGGSIKAEFVCEPDFAVNLAEQWGEAVSVREKSTKKGTVCLAKMKIEPGAAFYGWLTGCSDAVKLQGPDTLIRDYRKFLKELRSRYKEG